MREPTTKDFAELEAWGLDSDPFKAFGDYSDMKNELRWLNPQHRDAHWAYLKRRDEWISGKNFDHYYRVARKPIEREKWEFLMKRKAWYTPPLGWDNFAAPDVKAVLDLGCGDGDVTQRVADHIAAEWKKKNYDGHPIEVVGIDLNESRVLNARRLVKSPHPKITMRFQVGDAVTAPLDFADGYFAYVLNTGVLEILEEGPAMKMLDEMVRLSSKGIFIEDLLDHYPGGYPRIDLPDRIKARGFSNVDRHIVFTEPFTVSGSLDPMQLWPLQKDQVIFAQR